MYREEGWEWARSAGKTKRRYGDSVESIPSIKGKTDAKRQVVWIGKGR